MNMKTTDIKTLTGTLLLANGEKIQFTVTDAEAAQHIVTQITSGRLFARPNLIIASKRSLLISRTANVVRLDLDGDGLDGLLTLDGLGADVNRAEISREEWEERALRSEISDATRADIVRTPGKPVSTFGQLAMFSGTSVFLRYDLRAPTVLDQRRFLNEFFNNSVFSFRNQTGGVGLVNPANIVSATYYPGGEPPIDAWSVGDFAVQAKT
jgi:hypothetical protein